MKHMQHQHKAKMFNNSTLEEEEDRLFSAIFIPDVKTVKEILSRHPVLANRSSSRNRRTTPPLVDNSSTPLVDAARTGNREIIKALVTHGADVNASGNGYYTMWAYDRSTTSFGDNISPLMISTHSIHLPFVNEFLQAGARVNHTNALGQSALHVCCMHHDCSYFSIGTDEDNQDILMLLETLIKYGADVNLGDNAGRTPLHYACEFGNEYFLKTLIDNGAQLNLRDNNGFSVLETAAHHFYHLVDAMIKEHKFTRLEIIEAYEIVALTESCPSPFEWMEKATALRKEHNIPKAILEPLECYGFTKEWESLEELQAIKGNQQQLTLQAVLARERIYNGRYINQFYVVDKLISNVIQSRDKQQVNAFLQHHLELFKRNNDYLHFTSVFLIPYRYCYSKQIEDSLLWKLGTNFNLLETDTVLEIAEVAMESCQQIRYKLEQQTKDCGIEEWSTEYKKMLLTIAGLASKLMKRNMNLDNQPEKSLARGIFQQLIEGFEDPSFQLSGYKCPLLHVLCDQKFQNSILPINQRLPYDYELMKMLLAIGFDMNATDNDSNTLLHVMMNSLKYSLDQNTPQNINTNSVNTISLLLRSGMYFHARNKSGKAALEIINDQRFIRKSDYLKQIITEMEKYTFPTLKHIAARQIQESEIPYDMFIPKSLARFVDLA